MQGYDPPLETERRLSRPHEAAAQGTGRRAGRNGICGRAASSFANRRGGLLAVPNQENGAAALLLCACWASCSLTAGMGALLYG